MISSRRRLNNRVIQRTTSETIRIGEPDIVVNNHRPSNLPPLHAKKTVSSASFVVTGVSPRVDSITLESPDDSEEISRQTDIETPSFSEDTSYSQYTEDVDYCACEEIILKRCVVNAVMSNSDVYAQKNAQSLEKETTVSSSPITIITSSSSSHVGHIPSPGRFIGRFQVVKVESIHPFRRGRWICHDYVDNSEHAPRDGYEFFRGGFVKRNELDDIKKRIEDETFIFDAISNEHNMQGITQPLVHTNTSQLVFMNAPVLASNFHPIIRTENTVVQNFNNQKMIATAPRPILRNDCVAPESIIYLKLMDKHKLNLKRVSRVNSFQTQINMITS